METESFVEQNQTAAQKNILVFFRLALMNPKMAEEAAQETYNSIVKFAKVDPKAFDIIFVRNCLEIYKKARTAAQKARRAGDHPFELSGIDLSPWRDFIRQAPEEEILSLIWVQILNLPPRAVARGLSVSEGTVRHRVSRAIRKLSGKVDHGPSSGAKPAENKKLSPRRQWK